MRRPHSRRSSLLPFSLGYCPMNGGPVSAETRRVCCLEATLWADISTASPDRGRGSPLRRLCSRSRHCLSLERGSAADKRWPPDRGDGHDGRLNSAFAVRV